MHKRFLIQAPLYFVLSILFVIAMWSFWLPHQHAGAAEFGATVNVRSNVEENAKIQMVNIDDVFYLVYSSSSVVTEEYAVYFTSSSDGVSWSEPTLALDLMGSYPGPGEPLEFGFVYNSVKEEFALATRMETSVSEHDVIFTTSSNGVSWSATTTVVDDTGGGFINPNPKTPLGFSTSTGMYALGFFNQNFSVATSTDGVTWNSSTIFSADTTALIESTWQADVVDIFVKDDGEIQVILDQATSSTEAGGDLVYEIIYASSTDFGNTWTTSTVTGDLIVGQSIDPENDPFTMRDFTRAAFSEDGRFGITYYVLEAYNSGSGSVSGTIGYASSSLDYTWTTTTIDSAHTIDSLSGADRMHTSAIHFYSGNRAAITYYSDDDNTGGQTKIEFLAQSTTTEFTDTATVDNPSTGARVQIALAYVTSSQVVAAAYMDTSEIKFVTSSLRNPDLNSVASSTPFITPTVSTSTEAAGEVTVTTTITDADSDTVRLIVQFSTDDGDTWNDATITTSNAEQGDPSSGDGEISGITGSSSGNAISFVWNSTSDVSGVATTTTQFRIRPDDVYADGAFVTSASFEIDNVAPSSTNIASVTNITTSSTLTWTDATGASEYIVSTTASASDVQTSNTSTSFASLTPNTEYSYQVAVQDAFGNTADYTTSTSSYTNAAAPTNVAASSQGSDSMVVTWSSTNASGSTYELTNVTTGSVVGTTTETSYTVSGLTAETSYQFKVRTQFLSDSSTYSDFSSNSAAVSTDGSGGGGSTPSNPPSIPKGSDGKEIKTVKINNNAAQTNTVAVTLSFDVENAVQMAISNDDNFDDSSFESFASSRSWNLTPGNGTKKVYVKFRAADGSTIMGTDTIVLTGQSFDSEEEFETGGCPLSEEGAYKYEGSAAVYYVTISCEKRPFSSPAKFFSYFNSWDAVQIADKASIMKIDDDSLGFMPWGPLWDPQWGALVKHPGDPKVYLLLGEEKYWITSEVVFEALYGEIGWSWIEDVDPKLLDAYVTASEIDYTDHHPNYTVIKYANNSAVYRLEPDPTDSSKQVKRHVKNEKAFEALGFRWDRIVTISDSEVYKDGESLE